MNKIKLTSIACFVFASICIVGAEKKINPYSRHFSEDGGPTDVTIVTNVFTAWQSIGQIGKTNGVRQIGYLTTNRVLNVVHAGKTNQVLLDVIGKEEFPTQRRTNDVQSVRGKK